MLSWISILLFSSLSCSTSAASYDEALAWRYAQLAGAAYCPRGMLETWSCGEKCFPGVHSVKVCYGALIKAFVGKWESSCFASFGGVPGHGGQTTYLDTLNGWLYDHPVHAGFLGEWNNLQECIKQSLLDAGCGRQDGLSVTGHSVGAAVSTLGMYDLAKQGWKITEAYNFGSFRTAKRAFVKDFDEMFKGRFFRVTHGEDPVVDFPTGPFYLHVEPEVFYKGEVFEGYTICDVPKWPDNQTRCAAQYFPTSFEAMLEPALMSWHHKYLGVDTSMVGCALGSQNCGADIVGAWCALHIPCSVDLRGPEVHCHYPNWSIFGRCQCNDGYCPVDGRCEPKGALLIEGLAAVDPGSGASSHVPPNAATLLLGCAAFLACGLAAHRIARALQPDSGPDLKQRLMSEE